MAIITTAAEQKLAQLQGNTQAWTINRVVVANINGLDTSTTPPQSEALPAAADIVADVPVYQQGYVSPDMVVYTLFLDTTQGDYDFNWLGLVDADGVLVQVEYVSPRRKVKTAGGVLGNNITHNFFFKFSGAAAVTQITVPAESWQLDFSNQFRQVDERKRLAMRDIYGNFSVYGAGLGVTHDNVANEINISSGLAYIKGLRLDNASAFTLDNVPSSGSVYADIALVGQPDGREIEFIFTASASALNDYTDSTGNPHYVVKLADYNAGTVTDAPRNQLTADEMVKQFTTDLELAAVEQALQADVQALDSDLNTLENNVSSLQQLLEQADLSLSNALNQHTQVSAAIGTPGHVELSNDLSSLYAVGLSPSLLSIFKLARSNLATPNPAAPFVEANGATLTLPNDLILGAANQRAWMIMGYGRTQTATNGGNTYKGARLLDSANNVIVQHPTGETRNWVDGSAPVFEIIMIPAGSVPANGIVSMQIETRDCSYVAAIPLNVAL